jgi:protein SCO1/2
MASPNAAVVRRSLMAFLLLLAGAAAVAGVAFFALDGGRPGAPAPSAVGGPFALTDMNGKQVTNKDYEGRPVLMFFGFTRCPDVCPTALAEISAVFEALGPQAKVNALFVSVDPERDTPASLKDYLSSFDSRIIGLWGDPETTRAVMKSFRAFAAKVPLKDGDYTMDHTAIVYLLDKQGRFVNAFNIDRDPKDAAKELARYL